MRLQGTLTSWDDDRGFGFIETDDGTRRVFMHISAFPKGHGRPMDGQRMHFSVGRDEAGRERAERIQLSRSSTRPTSTPGLGKAGRGSRPARNIRWLALWPVPIFFGLLAWLVTDGRLPAHALLLYLGASFVCAVAYAADKRAARAEGWRTPESTLLLLGLVGGWPGGLIAQQMLRHKTRKTSFRVQFWLTVVIHTGVLVWMRGVGAPA